MSNLVMHDICVHYPNQSKATLSIPRLTISQGEKVAVMGVSGSGKTTLINMICGLQKPTVGSVKWYVEQDGEVQEQIINQMNQSQNDKWRFNHIGLIMQNFYLYPGLSALQNVLLPIGFRDFFVPKELKLRAEQLLNRVGIPFVDRKIELLSRGEMQRVAIVRALLNNPSIIIADEPTASLDSENGKQIMKLLFELVNEINATLIMVTHDPSFSDYFNRQIRLKDGAIDSDIRGESS